MRPNPALNLAPFGRWTLREKASRSACYFERWASCIQLLPLMKVRTCQ